jgi:hypothetical protein
MINNYLRKFHASDVELALQFFVHNGYVLIEGIYEREYIIELSEWIQSRFRRLLEKSKDNEIPFDINGWAVSIIKKLEQSPLYPGLSNREELHSFLRRILGTDICALGQEALWINYPTDDDPVLNKGVHTDAWTGTSVNTIFAKYFVTDCDAFNGMTVVPGSHMYGFVPCRNRAVDPHAHLDDYLEEINLEHARSGDLLIWHALLLHATRGHSDKNTRISITSRYKSTETQFSSQERSLGYRPICVGPLNQILRTIGSDSLSPFRTLGGHVGVDRRLQHLYGYGAFKPTIDYDKFIEP